jgi:hypothetical protein
MPWASHGLMQLRRCVPLKVAAAAAAAAHLTEMNVVMRRLPYGSCKPLFCQDEHYQGSQLQHPPA